jgi:hypothetical protein
MTSHEDVAVPPSGAAEPVQHCLDSGGVARIYSISWIGGGPLHDQSKALSEPRMVSSDRAAAPSSC